MVNFIRSQKRSLRIQQNIALLRVSRADMLFRNLLRHSYDSGDCRCFGRFQGVSVCVYSGPPWRSKLLQLTATWTFYGEDDRNLRCLTTRASGSRYEERLTEDL